MPIAGFIKYRKFMKWSIDYHIALQFEKILKKYLRNRAATLIQHKYKNYQKNICKTVQENFSAIHIQKYIRRGLCIKKMVNIKSDEQKLKTALKNLRETIDNYYNKDTLVIRYNMVNCINDLQIFIRKYK